MQITVPVVYDASVYTATKRLANRSYREYVTIDLVTIPADEAPVVASEAKRVPHSEVLILAPYRLVDGQVFEPVRHPQWGETRFLTDDASEHDHIVKALLDIKAVKRAVDGNDDGTPPTKRAGPPKPSTVSYSNRDRSLEGVNALHGGLIVVDGIVHRRKPEPLYEADHGIVRMQHDRTGTAREVVRYGVVVEDNHTANLFRLDELDLAIKRAALIAKIPTGEVKLPHFEVLDVGWLSADPDTLAMDKIRHKIRDAIAIHITSMPMEILPAYVELRDFEKTIRQDNFDRVEALRLAEQALEVLDDLGVKIFDEQNDRLVRDVIAVHHEREVRRPALSEIDAAALNFDFAQAL